MCSHRRCSVLKSRNLGALPVLIVRVVRVLLHRTLPRRNSPSQTRRPSTSTMQKLSSSALRCSPSGLRPVPVPVAGSRRLPQRCVAASSSAPAPCSVDESPSSTEPQAPSMLQSLRQHAGKAFSHMSALAFPLASITAGSNAELYGTLSKAAEIYLALLTVRVLMSWFRNINWHREPFSMIRQFTDPYLNLFRGVIPPLGGMDLSPMLGFFLLSFAAKQLKKMSYGL